MKHLMQSLDVMISSPTNTGMQKHSMQQHAQDVMISTKLNSFMHYRIFDKKLSKNPLFFLPFAHQGLFLISLWLFFFKSPK